jgi:hypothetical protein
MKHTYYIELKLVEDHEPSKLPRMAVTCYFAIQHITYYEQICMWLQIENSDGEESYETDTKYWGLNLVQDHQLSN